MPAERGHFYLGSYSVVGIFLDAVVGHVTHAFEFRDALKQGFLDAFLEGQVNLAAALAAAAEFQYGDAVLNHVDQADFAAMAGQAGVDLGLQVVADALVDRAVFINHRYFGVRRLDGQLAAHTVGGVVDYRVFKEGFAKGVDIGGEAFQPNGFVFRLFFAWFAVGNAGFGVLGTRLG